MADIPFIVISALVIVFNIVPWCWQVKHRNSGPVCLSTWVILANLNTLVNAVVWRDDAINRSPVFCDISQKILLAQGIGMLASDICILLLLCRVVGSSTRMITQRERHLRAVIDYSFCFGLPAFVMATHILYQPYRNGVARSTGCLIIIVNTWTAWVCFIVWQPLLSFFGCILAVHVGYRLMRHRWDFNRLVTNSNSALTASRFLRLGLLSTAVVLLNLPLSIYNVITSVPGLGVYAPSHWSYIHSQFAYTDYFPLKGRAAFTEWNSAIAGILVMIFFGFGGEAWSYYSLVFRKLGLKGRARSTPASEDDLKHKQTITLVTLRSDVETQADPAIALGYQSYEYDGPFNVSSKPRYSIHNAEGIKVFQSSEARNAC